MHIFSLVRSQRRSIDSCPTPGYSLEKHLHNHLPAAQKRVADELARAESDFGHDVDFPGGLRRSLSKCAFGVEEVLSSLGCFARCVA